MIEIVEAKFEHVVEIVERLRERDAHGLEMFDEAPEKVITRELSQSIVAYTGLVDGKVGAIWGACLAGILSDEARIWCIGTDLIETHPVSFIRHSRRAIADLQVYCKHLYGAVYADFDKSVAWLQWLGFEVMEPVNGVRMFRL